MDGKALSRDSSSRGAVCALAGELRTRDTLCLRSMFWGCPGASSGSSRVRRERNQREERRLRVVGMRAVCAGLSDCSLLSVNYRDVDESRAPLLLKILYTGKMEIILLGTFFNI